MVRAASLYAPDIWTTMRPTLPYLQSHFAAYNKRFFNDALPSVPIRLTNTKSRLGALKFRTYQSRGGACHDFQLDISTRYDLPESLLQDVLIHEMIHLYIAAKGIKDTGPHGTAFKHIMRTLNEKHGRHISVSEKLPKEILEKDTHIHPHYVCVSELEDGRKGITIAAQTRVFLLHSQLPQYYKLRRMLWYGSFNPYFNHFPKSLKPKIYLVDAEELTKALADAIELVCDGHVIKPKQKKPISS